MAANEVHAVCIDASCVAMFARAITRVLILHIYLHIFIYIYVCVCHYMSVSGRKISTQKEIE